MTKQPKPKKVIIYQNKEGKEPFSEWFDNLRDGKGKRLILLRLRRLEQGNMGDFATIGDKLTELRIFFGPGYRIYFGEDE